MKTYFKNIFKISCIRFFILLCISMGCNSENESQYEHDFQAECETISGSVDAGTEANLIGIDKIAYEAKKESNRFSLKALDVSGAELGVATFSFQTSQNIDRALVTKVDFEDENGSVETITESYIQGPLVQNTTVRRVGDTESVIRWTLKGMHLIDASISVRSDLPVDGEMIFALPGGTFAVLEYMKNGEMIVEEKAISDFISANGLDKLAENPTYQMMKSLLLDSQWQDAIASNIEACQGQLASELSSDLSISALTHCKESNPFGRVIEIESTLSVIGQGLVIGGIIAATGVGIVPALAIGILVSWVIDKVATKVASDADLRRGGIAIIAGTLEVSTLTPAGSSHDGVNFWMQPGVGKSIGDPHLTTFDGVGFSLQSAGEVILSRSLDGEFELQSRQVPIGSSICGKISNNTAFALKIPGARVEYHLDRSPRLTVNGNPLTPISSPIKIAPGVWVVSDGKKGAIIASPSGELVYFRGNSILVRHPPSRAGAYEGLLGNANGESNDDFVGTKGPIELPMSWETLHKEFVDNWRVDSQRSLFEYKEGENPMTYYVADFPSTRTSADNLPADVREEAEKACSEIKNEIAFSNCVFDVGCTGDPSFVDAHILNGSQIASDSEVPITFVDWKQRGLQSAGRWKVDPDGRGVKQLLNGDPTFFVSPESYINVRISGTMRADTSQDDDQIGFVFAYQNPSSPTKIEAYVLTWKAAAQTVNGLVAPEGLRLLYINTDYKDQVDEIFWDVISPDVRLLAEYIGEGTGWRNRDHKFELVYTTEKIEILIDGVQRIQLDSAAFPVPAKPGHFGFYNYSQANSYYSDFEASLVRP